VKDWDFFFAVFSFTDWIGHVLWKDIDETHPLYDSKTSPEVKKKFNDTWRKIDAIIGKLLSILPNDTSLMMVSDHGMGPLESVFYTNSWLEKKGCLRRKNLGWKNFLIEKIKLFSEGSDSKYFSAFINILRNKVLKTKGTMDLIDFENSLAYSPEHNTMFGCINLTKKGKVLNGFKGELIQDIKDLSHTVNGIHQVQIYVPEEIYSGPFVDLSPDIFFIINNHKSTVEIDFSREDFVASPSLQMRTGGHQPDGIFIARGDIFRNIRMGNVSILDIAPTIMALYGFEIPSQMDGKALTECIKPKVLESMNIRIGKDKKVPDDQQEGVQEGELEEMKNMLKSLGYM